MQYWGLEVPLTNQSLAENIEASIKWQHNHSQNNNQISEWTQGNINYESNSITTSRVRKEMILSL